MTADLLRNEETSAQPYLSLQVGAEEGDGGGGGEDGDKEDDDEEKLQFVGKNSS